MEEWLGAVGSLLCVSMQGPLMTLTLSVSLAFSVSVKAFLCSPLGIEGDGGQVQLLFSQT